MHDDALEAGQLAAGGEQVRQQRRPRSRDARRRRRRRTRSARGTASGRSRTASRRGGDREVDQVELRPVADHAARRCRRGGRRAWRDRRRAASTRCASAAQVRETASSSVRTATRSGVAAIAVAKGFGHRGRFGCGRHPGASTPRAFTQQEDAKRYEQEQETDHDTRCGALGYSLESRSLLAPPAGRPKFAAGSTPAGGLRISLNCFVARARVTRVCHHFATTRRVERVDSGLVPPSAATSRTCRRSSG